MGTKTNKNLQKMTKDNLKMPLASQFKNSFTENSANLPMDFWIYIEEVEVRLESIYLRSPFIHLESKVILIDSNLLRDTATHPRMIDTKLYIHLVEFYLNFYYDLLLEAN